MAFIAAVVVLPAFLALTVRNDQGDQGSVTTTAAPETNE
jgi:hypothetical protein